MEDFDAGDVEPTDADLTEKQLRDLQLAIDGAGHAEVVMNSSACEEGANDVMYRWSGLESSVKIKWKIKCS